jgi:hypothetical protein
LNLTIAITLLRRGRMGAESRVASA